MPSLLGKVIAKAAPDPGPPVPLSESGIWSLPGAGHRGGVPDESFLRAYGRNGTLFANLRLLASATAGPEWKLYRTPKGVTRQQYSTSDQGSDQREEVTQHAALALLTRPNGFWSRFRLFELGQLWQELTGKSHWVVVKRAGIPVSIWPVRPDRMQPVPDPQKYLLGWLYTAPGGHEVIALEPDEVIWNPLPDPVDLYGGTGPVQSVLTEVDAVRYAGEYNKNFFQNSARPDGVLSVDHRVSDEEWEELTDRWRAAHRGVSRAHRVAVLEGVTWVPTSTHPKDMDFATLMTTGGDRIREATAMHKIMTGLTEDVNRANAQTGEEIFAAWQVAPRLRRWRDVLNFQYLPMFGDSGKGVEFDFLYPMPVNREQDHMELTAKSNAYLALVTAGVDPRDAATTVGLPPMRTISQPPPGGLPPGKDASVPSGGQGTGSGAENRLASRSWTALDDVMRQQAAAWNSLAGAR